ncbi:MAG: M20/M25/M40 family metallo-hydrolase [Pseudomonadota bacterium]
MIKPARLRRLLTNLLDIYSPSGKEEDVVDFLHGYLKRRGLPVVRQEVDERRSNLVVAPAGNEAQVAFIGHLDTVGAFDLEDFGHEEDGDMVIGLGASDMKSGCAAMIETFVSLYEDGARDFPLILALVVGEEEEGDGAQALAGDYHFPWAVIGEPTDLEVCLSHYGYMEIQAQARGRGYHASLARNGHNPIEDMLRLLLRVTDYLGSQRPELVYNIRDLFSTGGGFAVPESCETWLDVHLPPTTNASEISLELEDQFERERQANPSLEARLWFHTVQAGFTLPEKGPLVEVLRDVFAAEKLAWTPRAFPSHSDANLLWSLGVKPIILGCGRLEMAHRPEEAVSFAQVTRAAEIFHKTALGLLSRKG